MAIKTYAPFGVTLEEQALELYLRARVAGCPGGITSDYRDPDLQVRLFHENYTRDYATSAKYDARKWGTVTYWRRHYNTRTKGSTVAVAVPGTSRHEYGIALDLPGSKTDTSTPRGWMHKHGRRFGWYWPTWAQKSGTYEPWHVEFDPALIDIDMEDDMELNDRVNIKALSSYAASSFGVDSTTVEHLLAQLGHAPNATRAYVVAGRAEEQAAAALAEVLAIHKEVKALTAAVAKIQTAGIDVAAFVKAVNDDAARRLAQ